MKLFLGIIVILISGLVGIFFSNKYSDRFRFFNSFLSFNKLLKKEVSFNQSTIVSLIKENTCDEFNKSLYEMVINKKNDIKINYLKEDEKKFFYEYISFIGKSDSTSQLKYIESCENYLEDKVKEVFAEKNKYKPLCIKLGFLFGLILFVLII